MKSLDEERRSVQEKIRQLENRQKILFKGPTRSARPERTALLNMGQFWRVSFLKSSL